MMYWEPNLWTFFNTNFSVQRREQLRERELIIIIIIIIISRPAENPHARPLNHGLNNILNAYNYSLFQKVSHCSRTVMLTFIP